MMEQRIGQYQILEEIASGGQATVYRAWDTDTGHVVALKVIHPHLVRDTDYLERFHREARLAASIDHPNVVKIFEVGQEEQSYFISMEFLPLSINDLIVSQGPLPVERAVYICYQTALALQSAHDQGIVHRDIKPHNILIATDGTAKVGDFGIARAADLSTMTRTGALLGTPQYMAPEQANGQRADVRSDLYSLGCVLYQMLTGEVPFDGKTPWEVIRQHIQSHPKKVNTLRSEVPSDLNKLVDRCLEKDPAQRYQIPNELAQALVSAVPGATSPRPNEYVVPPMPRRLEDEGPSSGPRDPMTTARRLGTTGARSLEDPEQSPGPRDPQTTVRRLGTTGARSVDTLVRLYSTGSETLAGTVEYPMNTRSS